MAVVEHLEAEKDFLRMLLDNLPKPVTNEYGTVRCLSALVDGALSYMQLLPASPLWPPRLAERVDAIEVIVGSYVSGRSIQDGMSDPNMDFRCSLIFRGQLVLVREEVTRRARLSRGLASAPLIPQEPPDPFQGMNNAQVHEMLSLLEVRVRRLEVLEDAVALSFWCIDRSAEDSTVFTEKHPAFKRTQHSFMVTRLILLRTVVGWLRRWREQMTVPAALDVVNAMSTLEHFVMACSDEKSSPSTYNLLAEEDTAKILRHLLEARRKGLRPGQDPTAFNVGCSRLASFLIQLIPPGALNDNGAR